MRSESVASSRRGVSDIVPDNLEPSTETCDTDNHNEDLQERIVRHCSPTLAGLKCGSMFRTDGPHGIQSIDGALRPKGVRVSVISTDNKGVLVYVYRPDILGRRLSEPDVREFLRGYGYAQTGPEGMVSQLAARFLCCSMPLRWACSWTIRWRT